MVVLSLWCPALAEAPHIKVIAHPSVPVSSISNDELRRVYLLTKTSLGGSHVEIVLSKRGAAHAEFLRTVVSKTDGTLKTYYRQMIFTGTGFMPVMCDSEDEVVAYVAKTKGAIGYVSPQVSLAGVKVIELK